MSAKNLASSWPYSEMLCEGKFKESELICLTEETVRQNGFRADAEEAILIHEQVNTIVKGPVLHFRGWPVCPQDQHTKTDTAVVGQLHLSLQVQLGNILRVIHVALVLKESRFSDWRGHEEQLRTDTQW